MSTPGAIFVREGAHLLPTAHAVGPWDPGQLHGGAPGGLLASAMAALAPELHLARAAFEFLGPVPLAPLEVRARITKPGTRFALAEAEVVLEDGRTALQARGVLLRRGAAPMGLPDGLVWEGAGGAELPGAGPFGPPGAAEGFHVSGMEIVPAEPTADGPGAAAGWFRLGHPLVAGEPTPAEALVVGASDFCNGLSRVLPFETHLFVNCDLTVTLVRPPAGDRVCVDAVTRIDPAGIGWASGVLRDEQGPIGFAQQTLFVAER